MILFQLDKGRKEIFLFNDTLNIFYLQLYGVRHMVKDHAWVASITTRLFSGGPYRVASLITRL